MRHWPLPKIMMVLGSLLMVVGIIPLAYLLWYVNNHNFQPLSMSLPFEHGHYTSAVFKTDLDESYVIQVEFSSPTGRSIDLNQEAILDLDWKLVDSTGATLQRGFQNTTMRGANGVNLAEYRPKRGDAQQLVIELNQDLAEPEGSHVTVEVNSTEDPEGRAFAYYYAVRWALIAAVPGLILLVSAFVIRTTTRDTFARTP
jgi:hypothetical protein